MYKEKVRELLKEVPEVKEQMEKLTLFGPVKLIKGDNSGLWNDNRNHTNIVKIENNEYGKMYRIGNGRNSAMIGIYEKDFYKEYIYLGNKLQERFIRMYCEKKNILHSFQFNRLDIGCDAYSCKYNIIIDNTKDLENQSETFYNELYESLLELNKLG